jgi:peptide/nickel transport system permease protein
MAARDLPARNRRGFRGRGTFRILIGLTMIAILLVLAVFGPALAPYPRDYSEKLYEKVTDDGVEILYAPQPPSLRHPMGTDRWGFDIVSLLFFGARYTVFGALGVALARVLIGGAIGLISGIRKGAATPSRLAGVLGAIPSFVIVYFVMVGININSPYSPLTLTLIQSAVMTIIGIPTVATVVREKSVRLRNLDHVNAAIALGAGRTRVARRHILPLLREDLMVLVVHEVVIVLTLLGQLAIFDMFLGGTVRWEDPVVYVPLTHEWAGLIGYARPAVQVYQWILVSPLIAFLFAVFAFQMLATGLERRIRTEYVKTPHV